MMPIGLSFLAYMVLGMFAMKLVSMSAHDSAALSLPVVTVDSVFAS